MLWIGFLCINQEFNPESGFIGLLQDGAHLRYRIRLGLGSASGSVVRSNGCPRSQKLTTECSRCVVPLELFGEPYYGQREFARSILQILVFHGFSFALCTRNSPPLSGSQGVMSSARRFAKAEARGASPRGSASLRFCHQLSSVCLSSGLWCNSSISRCERDGPGANPGFLTSPTGPADVCADGIPRRPVIESNANRSDSAFVTSHRQVLNLTLPALAQARPAPGKSLVNGNPDQRGHTGTRGDGIHPTEAIDDEVVVGDF